MVKDVYRFRCNAKINAFLKVGGKRGNLHTINSLVIPCNAYFDSAKFYPDDRQGFDVSVSSILEDFDEERFLKFIMPKLDMIATKLDIGGKLELYKGVPLGAGLGGSTASIVATLLCAEDYLSDKGNFDGLDDEFLMTLGSDVKCMLYGKSCILRGVGDEIIPVDIDFKEQIYIVTAKGGSDSGKCYRLFDEMNGLPDENLKNSGLDAGFWRNFLTPKNMEEKEKQARRIFFGLDGVSENLKEEIIKNAFENDLTLPAVINNPSIGRVIEDAAKNYNAVFMTGSGGGVIFC